ncbi:MAG: acyltransferase [Salinibacterium sp.]|nr:acyltransferase [Salinibacterium sp.]MBF0673449.1 acyltransferase [Salinibacterium sp.]
METSPAQRVVPASKGQLRSIATALNGTHNSLGFIRLALALLVIVDHAFVLGGFGFNPIHELTGGQASLGSIAVAGFFAISGYLIAKSGQSGDVLQFLWRRTLRIFPAFWTVLAVTAFVVGPAVWMIGGNKLGSYFALDGDGPFEYLARNWTLFIGAHGINGLFLNTPYGLVSGMSEMNGSLWTLSLEWACYMMIAALIVLSLLRQVKIVVPLVAGLFLLAQLGLFPLPSNVPVLSVPAFAGLALAFLIGASIAVYSHRVPFHDGLGVLAALVFAGTLRFGGFAWLGTVAGVYFVLYLGARLPRWLQWIGSRNDYSYGTYIYGFLVQQVLANFGLHEWGYAAYVALTVAITLPLAWLSWHLIEKRAMALKSRGPGRGMQHWAHRIRGRWRTLRG